MENKPGLLGANGTRRVGQSILHVQPGPAFPPSQSSQPAKEDGPLALANRLIEQLLDAPDHIRQAQEAFDKADCVYKAKLAEVSIEALGRQIFPAKDGGLRAASNDTERQMAVDQAVATSPALIHLAVVREATLRELVYARNVLDTARIVTQLLVANK